MESINEGNGDDSELNVVVRQADLHTAILEAVQKRGYTENQAMAIVCGSVSLPSGSGKSLCYAAFPEVSDSLKRRANIASDHHSIAVVVPPPSLSSLKNGCLEDGGVEQQEIALTQICSPCA